MDEKRGMKKLDLGPTGAYTAARIAEVRTHRGFTYQGLAAKLVELKWPIPELGLRRIESQARRVTVDDVMALAAALGVSPLELMIPTATTSLPSPTGTGDDVSLDEAWAWALQKLSLDKDDRINHWQHVEERASAAAEEMSATLEALPNRRYAKYLEHDRRTQEGIARKARARIIALSNG